MNDQIVFILIDNIIMGIAAFLAIVVWVKTRDISWIFIVLSVIGFYVGIIYKTLLFFGIAAPLTIKNINLIEVIFYYIPLILIVVALMLKAIKNMKR